jgi:hypothetical protein
MKGCAGHLQGTAIGLQHTGKQSHQRAFSSTILADDSEHFTCVGVQLDLTERLIVTKALAQARDG